MSGPSAWRILHWEDELSSRSLLKTRGASVWENLRAMETENLVLRGLSANSLTLIPSPEAAA